MSAIAFNSVAAFVQCGMFALNASHGRTGWAIFHGSAMVFHLVMLALASRAR